MAFHCVSVESKVCLVCTTAFTHFLSSVCLVSGVGCFCLGLWVGTWAGAAGACGVCNVWWVCGVCGVWCGVVVCVTLRYALWSESLWYAQVMNLWCLLCGVCGACGVCGVVVCGVCVWCVYVLCGVVWCCGVCVTLWYAQWSENLWYAQVMNLWSSPANEYGIPLC